MLLVVAQVHKLHGYNLSAACVSEGNNQKYKDIKRGRYRYGMGGSFELVYEVCLKYV